MYLPGSTLRVNWPGTPSTTFSLSPRIAPDSSLSSISLTFEVPPLVILKVVVPAATLLSTGVHPASLRVKAASFEPGSPSVEPHPARPIASSAPSATAPFLILAST